MIKVSSVVLFGRVTVTAATVQALLEHQIALCYLSQHGRYVGCIEPALSKNSLLRTAQYRAAFAPTVTLALARQMVRGKLSNMRVLLQRANRGLDDPALTQAVERLKMQLLAVDAAGRTYYECKELLRLCRDRGAEACPPGVACVLRELDGHAHR